MFDNNLLHLMNKVLVLLYNLLNIVSNTLFMAIVPFLNLTVLKEWTNFYEVLINDYNVSMELAILYVTCMFLSMFYIQMSINNYVSNEFYTCKNENVVDSTNENEIVNNSDSDKENDYDNNSDIDRDNEKDYNEDYIINNDKDNEKIQRDVYEKQFDDAEEMIKNMTDEEYYGL